MKNRGNNNEKWWKLEKHQWKMMKKRETKQWNNTFIIFNKFSLFLPLSFSYFFFHHVSLFVSLFFISASCFFLSWSLVIIFHCFLSLFSSCFSVFSLFFIMFACFFIFFHHFFLFFLPRSSFFIVFFYLFHHVSLVVLSFSSLFIVFSLVFIIVHCCFSIFHNVSLFVFLFFIMFQIVFFHSFSSFVLVFSLLFIIFHCFFLYFSSCFFVFSGMLTWRPVASKIISSFLHRHARNWQDRIFKGVFPYWNMLDSELLEIPQQNLFNIISQ